MASPEKRGGDMKCEICQKIFGTPDSKRKTCGKAECMKQYKKQYNKQYQKTDKYKQYKKQYYLRKKEAGI